MNAQLHNADCRAMKPTPISPTAAVFAVSNLFPIAHLAQLLAPAGCQLVSRGGAVYVARPGRALTPLRVVSSPTVFH